MSGRIRIGLIVSLLFLTFSPLNSVSADIGPKPTMDFEFKQEIGEPLTIISGIMVECEQADCSDGMPLEELGPQGLFCDETSCDALAYGFSPYHRLDILFSDGITRQSNIFETDGFYSNYTVTIRQDSLWVEPQASTHISLGIPIFVACSCCIIGVGILVLVIVLLVRHSKKKM